MRQVSVKSLNKHLSAELEDLPFAVTKYGKIIGVMVASEGVSQVLISTDHKGTDKAVRVKKGTDKIKWTNPLSNSALTPKEQWTGEAT